MSVPESTPPAGGGVNHLLALVWWKLNDLAAMSYIGAASLVGFETLALVLGFATAWPIAIPMVVAVLAAVFYLSRPVIRFFFHSRG